VPDKNHSIERTRLFTLANGHDVELIVHSFTGQGPGPVLGVASTIHGDEPLSIETTRRLCGELALEQFRGTLLVMPVANAYAFHALTRNTPLDMINLNRVFPGDPDGSMTEQLAHAIVTHFLNRCDYLIDLHSGGNLAVVDYSYMQEPDEGLSRVLGLDVLYRSSSPPGTLTGVAVNKHLKAVVAELGGGQLANDRFVRRGVRGVKNVMKHLDMLDGDLELPQQQVLVKEMRIIRPHQGGILASDLAVESLGAHLPHGQVLGRTYNPYTFEVLETFTAPFDPTVVVLLRESVTKVDPGDFAFILGNGATAETLSTSDLLTNSRPPKG
jgi:predicted deacylase